MTGDGSDKSLGESGNEQSGENKDGKLSNLLYKRDSTEFHAMILLGGRWDVKTKTKWLWFKNWWNDMQIVEISDEYLKNATGTLCFFGFDPEKNLKDTISVENCYSMNESLVAESNNLDMPESAEGHPWEGLQER